MCPCKIKERYPLRNAMERGDAVLTDPELRNVKLQKTPRPLQFGLRRRFTPTRWWTGACW